ncbi:MAG: DUF1552 domain-containing protein [Planctomycetes bacterium]|nr:DUF1552 domain-containing protein [Planctomycetota bacterium]
MTRTRYHRRDMLRALGALLAVPTLESLAPAAWQARQVPRLVYAYVPNGVHLPDWRPTEEGPDFALPYLLEPLAPWRDRLTVVRKLVQDKARANGDGGGDHARAAAAWLTGVQPLKSATTVRLGVSADQLAAEHFANVTPFKSLQLGCEDGTLAGQCDTGYACAYSCHVAWQNETTPAGKLVRPGDVFDLLFRGGHRNEDLAELRRLRARRRSVLDYVRDEARRAGAEADAADRAKLDEYLSGVRELERRVARLEAERVDEVADAECPPRSPESYTEHLRAFYDLIVLALRTDRTRVVTFMAANEGSNRSYPNLDIHEGHHSISHHKGEAAKQQQIRAINRFHSEELARFVGALAATEDGPGSLLDAVLLCYGSCIADGNAHTHHDLPTLLLGGGAGTLRGGRHLVPAEEVPMGNFHLALLQRMGVAAAGLGDATGVMAL